MTDTSNGLGQTMNAIVTSKSYALDQGLTHGVVGPNGIGKTTLLRQNSGAATIERPTSFWAETF